MGIEHRAGRTPLGWVAVAAAAAITGWSLTPAPGGARAPAPEVAGRPVDGPAAPADFYDMPLALNGGPDGSVWVMMITDYFSSGAVQYDADLVYNRRWEVRIGTGTGLAVHPGGDVFLGHQRLSSQGVGFSIGRYAPDGTGRPSWDIPGRAAQLDVAADGSLVALVEVEPTATPTALPAGKDRRILRFEGDGTPLGGWDVDPRAAALAVDAGGRVFVGDHSGPLGGSGNIVRYGPDGRREAAWVVAGEPAGMGALPDGRIVVLYLPELANRPRIEIFTPDGTSLGAWDTPPDVPEGSYARPVDLAVGPACDVYALITMMPSPGGGASQLLHYTCDGTLRRALRGFEIVPISFPDTPTPAARMTRTATPSAPSASPTFVRTISPSLTVTPTSTPTSTPTQSLPPGVMLHLPRLLQAVP